MRNQIDTLDTALQSLIATLVDRAESDGRVVVPGYTHLQRGQPIWLAHQLLAHAWSLSRDRERLADTRKRVNRSPSGCGSHGGHPTPSTVPAPQISSRSSAPMPNAMDAVSARDHVLELVSTCAIIATHLSRWPRSSWCGPPASSGFGERCLVDQKLHHAAKAGTPMPPRLVRGRTGRATGALVSLLTLVKALPLAYNRDLQEDRVALFPAVASVLDCVQVLDGCYGSMDVQGGPDLTETSH